MAEMPSAKVILISGANGGIGTAVAQELMSDHQLSLGVRTQHHDEQIRGAVSQGVVHTGVFDAHAEQHADEWITSVVKAFGRIDAVVNCIGTFSDYRFTDDSFDRLDDLIAVNLKAPIRVIRAAYPELVKAANPKVINLVSLSGLRVGGDSVGYSMSKFALRALGQSIKRTGWDANVRVTSLFPGWVNTRMAAGRAPVSDEQMTQPEDIAKIVRLLLSLPPTCSISEMAINCLYDPLL